MIAKHPFEPCYKHRDCASCRGSYLDQRGESVTCPCEHHSQGELLAEHRIVSKQIDLFART